MTWTLLHASLLTAIRRSGLRASALAVLGVVACLVAAGLVLSASLAVGEGTVEDPRLAAAMLVAWSASFVFAASSFLGSGPRSSDEGRRWRALPASPRARWAAAIGPSGALMCVAALVLGPATLVLVSATVDTPVAIVAVVAILSALHGTALGLLLDGGVHLLHRGRLSLLLHRMAVSSAALLWLGILAACLRWQWPLPHPVWGLFDPSVASLIVVITACSAPLLVGPVLSARAFAMPVTPTASRPVVTAWLERLPGATPIYAARMLRNRHVSPYFAYVAVLGTAIGIAITWGPGYARELSVDLWALVLPLGALPLQLGLGLAGPRPYETLHLGVPARDASRLTALTWLGLIVVAVAPGFALTLNASPSAAATVAVLLVAHGLVALALGHLLLPSPTTSADVLVALAAQAGSVVTLATLWSRWTDSVLLVAVGVAISGLIAATLSLQHAPRRPPAPLDSHNAQRRTT